jgi:hypothetical protein
MEKVIRKKYEQASKRLRKNPDYYLKELEANAKRNKGKNLSPKRIKQIKKLYKERQRNTGIFRKPRRWKESEISYLQENYKNISYEDMGLYLNRSWASVCHKMERLKLTKYHKWN